MVGARCQPQHRRAPQERPERRGAGDEQQRRGVEAEPDQQRQTPAPGPIGVVADQGLRHGGDHRGGEGKQPQLQVAQPERLLERRQERREDQAVQVVQCVAGGQPQQEAPRAERALPGALTVARGTRDIRGTQGGRVAVPRRVLTVIARCVCRRLERATGHGGAA